MGNFVNLPTVLATLMVAVGALRKGSRTLPDSASYHEYYKGFEIIARFYQGEYQGRAWHPLTHKQIEADGVGISPLVERLKTAVNADLAANTPFYRQLLADKHQSVLKSIGKRHRRQGTLSRRRGAKNCYRCHGPVDNLFDLDCRACGWIICTYCASCGCGY